MRNRIKDLRDDHDMTQQQVADAIGITQRKYSYVETGTQPLTDELLSALADLYGVSVDLSAVPHRHAAAVSEEEVTPPAGRVSAAQGGERHF